jgi:hypothetical protein
VRRCRGDQGHQPLLHPCRRCLSLNGPAIVGLAARTLERNHGADGFLPVRLTADLFKAAHRVPTEVRTRLLREGVTAIANPAAQIDFGRPDTAPTLRE